MITRRQFIGTTGTAALAQMGTFNNVFARETVAIAPNTAGAQNQLMYVGHQGDCSQQSLQFYKRCGLGNFQEVYHDEGDIDMCRAMKVLKEVNYAGMVMPDHVPGHPDDRGGTQAFAFAFGYIKGLMQAAYAES